jgi:outer membrane protein OmpA-like peptidoglycan-associated protein
MSEMRAAAANLVLLFACGAPAAPVEAPVIAIPAASASSSPEVDRRPLVFTAPSAKKPAPRDNGLAQLTDRAIVLSEPIVFAVGKAALLPDSDSLMDGIVAVMRANPSVTIEVRVHTDNQGASAYNMALSQQRADAVVGALIARGVDRARMSASGRGSTEPLVPNTTAENRAINRRTEIVRTDRGP